jgi:putative tryptophan/tyrosine transport system substrate-binding protein
MTSVMERRAFLGTLAGVLVAVPLAAKAQQAGKIYRIGLLWPDQACCRPRGYLEAFQEGLRERGWVEGQNFTIELRWSEGQDDLLPELAAELVRLQVDVLVAITGPAVIAVKDATSSIPIVMGIVGDAVGSGLVSNLARPGGNITGTTLLYPDVATKQLDLLREILPRLSRVAVLWNAANPLKANDLNATKNVAQKFGITLQLLQVREVSDFTAAFELANRRRSEALVVLGDPFTYIHRSQILEAVTKLRIPVIYDIRQSAEDGALIAYTANVPAALRRTAAYVDKILKGAKPGDLPVEQPSKFELIINLKTARALGLRIPPSLLWRADEVIQ